MGGGCSKDWNLSDSSDSEDEFHAGAFSSVPLPEAEVAHDEDPLRLSAQVPIRFDPFKSSPRLPEEPPFKRLMLISSRVHDCLKVADHALPCVAVVVYDWRVFTLQELLRAVKKVLAGSKVLSIAVVAPGSKPGCVGLLDGCSTSAEKLEPLIHAQQEVDTPLGNASHPLVANAWEVAQFWRALASLVTTNEKGEGKRVDLLGCRLEEAPQEGAALLKVLMQLTSVPFAAADSVQSNYQLLSYCENHTTHKLGLRASPIRALGLYFDRAKLLGTPQPLPYQKGAQEQMVAVIQADKDIFIRFAERIRKLKTPLPKIFRRFDTSQTGYLSLEEVGNLVRAVCPDARPIDVEHVASMLDLEGNNGVTLIEFQEALDQDTDIERAVLQGKDDMGFMPALCAYLSNNEASFREYFKSADASRSGTLCHKELVSMVHEIEGLDKKERKHLLSFFYQLGGELDFDTMLHAIQNYGSQQPGISRMQPPASSSKQPAVQTSQQALLQPLPPQAQLLSPLQQPQQLLQQPRLQPQQLQHQFPSQQQLLDLPGQLIQEQQHQQLGLQEQLKQQLPQQHLHGMPGQHIQQQMQLSHSRYQPPDLPGPLTHQQQQEHPSLQEQFTQHQLQQQLQMQQQHAPSLPEPYMQQNQWQKDQPHAMQSQEPAFQQQQQQQQQQGPQNQAPSVQQQQQGLQPEPVARLGPHFHPHQGNVLGSTGQQQHAAPQASQPQSPVDVNGSLALVQPSLPPAAQPIGMHQGGAPQQLMQEVLQEPDKQQKLAQGLKGLLLGKNEAQEELGKGLQQGLKGLFGDPGVLEQQQQQQQLLQLSRLSQGLQGLVSFGRKQQQEQQRG